jgi:2-haloacid dehalogenase
LAVVGRGARRHGKQLASTALRNSSQLRRDPAPSTVIFDLGGVLIDWDPRHLYRQLFADPSEMEAFLAEVTTAEWNGRQDEGRAWVEAIDELVAEHPEKRELIEAFHRRWPEMLAGEVPGSVDVLRDVRAAGVRLLALSNWSSETFSFALERFEFLSWFEAIVISGDVKARKPHPAIFEHLIDRYGVQPPSAVFIDDSEANVETAHGLGFVALRFSGAQALRRNLHLLGVIRR